MSSLEIITNSIGQGLVLIPAGTFTMGSPPSEKYHFDNETQHQVTLTGLERGHRSGRGTHRSGRGTHRSGRGTQA